MNAEITYQVIQNAIDHGVREFVVCAGSRNSSFVQILRKEKELKIYYHPEERSAAFFASGRSKITQCPIAIVTTSGTAVVELFPATMDAYYSGIPLLLMTADRPKRFRGCGAPQSAEQENIFGQYATYFQDVDGDTKCNLSQWKQTGPAHINICLEEPQKEPIFECQKLNFKTINTINTLVHVEKNQQLINDFLMQVDQPIVIVGMLNEQSKEAVVELLLKLQVPVFLEAISGLRQEVRLQHLRIYRTDQILEKAFEYNYTIDGVLRVGGIPTHRIWRDLEYQRDTIKVCSITQQPFSGLSWNQCMAHGSIKEILQTFKPKKTFVTSRSQKWLTQEKIFAYLLFKLFTDEPKAECSLIHELSQRIPDNAFIYLGNSLPIREWDIAATSREKQWLVTASRGVNGIDGQISNFLGQCQDKRDNWAIIGDLTALYDLAGLWILSSLKINPINLVIINNGGGKIFEKMYPFQEMLNCHHLNFEHLANFWGLTYERWDKVPDRVESAKHRLIEIIPDTVSSHRFADKLTKIEVKHLH